MSIQNIKKNIEQKMHRSIESLKNDLAKVRTGRAHIGLLDHIRVNYYGSMVSLSQIANISLIDARTISVEPWEKKAISSIEKAIRDSDLGLNPHTHNEYIRVPMPILTEDRRRELVKLIKNEAESTKVAIRNLRREANEQVKRLMRDKLASEDEERRSAEEIQKLTDRHVAEIDTLIQKKEVEIMTL